MSRPPTAVTAATSASRRGRRRSTGNRRRESRAERPARGRAREDAAYRARPAPAALVAVAALASREGKARATANAGRTTPPSRWGPFYSAPQRPEGRFGEEGEAPESRGGGRRGWHGTLRWALAMQLARGRHRASHRRGNDSLQTSRHQMGRPTDWAEAGGIPAQRDCLSLVVGESGRCGGSPRNVTPLLGCRAAAPTANQFLVPLGSEPWPPRYIAIHNAFGFVDVIIDINGRLHPAGGG